MSSTERVQEPRHRALRDLLKKHGLLSLHSQETLRLVHGTIPGETIEAVAWVFVENLLEDRKLPSPTGMMRKELFEIAEHACLEELELYRKKGGILLAKDMVDASTIFAAMIREWVCRFPEPQKVSRQILEGLGPEERIARFSVAAQNLEKLFTSLHAVPGGYLVPAERLEHLCMMAARAAVAAFDRPNEAVESVNAGKVLEG